MNKPERVVFLACAFIIALHAVASFLPEERLWGVNQLAYLPPFPRWAIIILAFLILVPRINKMFYGLFAEIFSLVERNLKRINRYHKFILFSLASIALFWIFKAETHLLGDGYLRARDVMAGAKFSVTEPLDFYLHALAYRLLRLDGFGVYALLSCLAGAFFVFLALSLSCVLGKENKERVLALVILVSMGSVQLFFGYVESYTLVYVGIMAYFLFSLWFLEGKCSLVFPILALLFSISLHLSALYLLPSLIYLCLGPSKREEEAFNWKGVFRATALLLVVAGGLFILGTQHPDKASPANYLLSSSGSPKDSYSLFSFAHLVDMLNQQFLISPVGIVLLPLIAFLGLGKLNRKDKTVGFLMVVTLCSFVFAFVIDPELGYARDWDLFSSTGLGYTLLGIYLGFGLLRQATIKKSNYIVLALASTAVFCTLPWIYVNAQEQRAVERFKALLVLDVQRSAYGHEILAYYYRDRGAIDQEAEEWKKALSVIENERYLVNLGGSYMELGRYQEAITTFKKAIQLNPNSADGHYNLGIGFARIGSYQEAEKHYRMAIDKDPYLLDAYTNLGGLFIGTGEYQKAVEILNSAIQKDPDYFPAYYNVVVAYSRMGRTQDGIQLLRAYLERNPEDRERVRQLLRKMNISMD